MHALQRMALIGMTLLGASAGFGQQVRVDYDRGADFSVYKTYQWRGVHTEDELWVDRIKSAVGSTLTAKGWTESESGADACIMAMEMSQDHRTLNTYYDNFGGGWNWGGGVGAATTTEQIYKVGTLVVVVFDARTKMLIWRGSSSEVLSSKSEKNIRNLNRGVAKMFEHFPPDTLGSARVRSGATEEKLR